MKKRILILTLLLALPLTGQTTVDLDRDSDSRKAASEGLGELAALARETPQQRGGLTAEEAARAQLLPPIRVLFVPLDALKAYTAGADPRALLRDTGTIFYPVAVDGNVRSSVAVARSGGRWKPVEIGRAKLATAVEAVRASTPDVTAIVHVPALNLVFVASENGGTLRLISLQNSPENELRFGEGDTADRILARLVPLAQRNNGDPT